MIESFDGARAFVTGAGSGIGRALVRALLREGARVVAADSDAEALRAERARAADSGHELTVTQLDVSVPEDMDRAKDLVDAELGGVDLLVNNAGVAFNSLPLWEVPPEIAQWMYGVNVHGVLNGIRCFVPDMIRQGFGHVLNTASIGGFQVRRSLLWHQGLYASTKYAVVAISEALAQDLEDHGIGVSVLAPAAVNTGIVEAQQLALHRFGIRGAAVSEGQRDMLAQGMSPDVVAKVAIEAIRTNRRYVFTHPEERPLIERRHAEIEAALSDASLVLESLKR